MRVLKAGLISIVVIVVFVIALWMTPVEYLVTKNRGTIDHVGDVTELKLKKYELFRTPGEIRAWLTGPHDGAFGQQIAWVFLRWGLANPQDFEYILDGIDDAMEPHIVTWLGIGVSDAMINDEFLHTFANSPSPLVRAIREDVLKRQF